MLGLLVPLLAASGAAAQDGVIATGPNGPTNPDRPEFLAIGSTINQASDARLITLNSVDDFCMYAPPNPGPDSTVGNTEHEVVAWCTKPRNNARLIPDGVIKSAQFIRTDAYVQISGWWDGTKLNIPAGDDGGELDPHGPTGDGNPVGGNVTSNVVGGQDVFYEEWMSFVSDDQFCLRVCTANYNDIPAALMCEHELDLMGCNFVMAIPWEADQQDFTECDGDVAAPPGLYPQPDGSYSTFRQRFTGSWDGAIHTIGNTVTPSDPAFFPQTSNCKTYATISNGVNTADWSVTASPTLLSDGDAQPPAATAAATDSAEASQPTASPAPAASGSSGNAAEAPAPTESAAPVAIVADPQDAVELNGEGSNQNAQANAQASSPSSAGDHSREVSVFGAFAALAGSVLALI